ncbi:MAG: hypothetical protein ABIF82_04785, partial [Planctomycetota bacterium]
AVVPRNEVVGLIAKLKLSAWPPKAPGKGAGAAPEAEQRAPAVPHGSQRAAANGEQSFGAAQADEAVQARARQAERIEQAAQAQTPAPRALQEAPGKAGEAALDKAQAVPPTITINIILKVKAKP